MTHTKGPWRVEGEESIHIGDYPLMHAVIRSKEERWTALAEVEDEEGEANARLIAAAPTMYDALRDCLESLKRLPDVEGAYRVTCIWQAQTALAQAEGKVTQ